MDYRRYDRRDLPGIIAIREAEGWPSLPADPERAPRTRLPGFRLYPPFIE